MLRRELLAGAVTGMEEALGIIDCQGRVQLGNPAFLRLLPAGSLLTELLPEDERYRLELSMRWICSGQHHSMQLAIADKDGSERIMLLNSGPCGILDGMQLYSLMLTDITSLHQAENEKLYLLEQMLGSRQIDRLGTLAGGLSHEFNNILQVIRANAEGCLLERNLRPGEQSRLRDILSGTQRAEQLLQRLLAFSRHQDPDHSEFRLSQMLRKMLSLATLRSQIPVDCGLELLTQNDVLIGDPAQIEQAVSQLISNAQQSLPEEGGRLRIRILEPREAMLERLPRADARVEQFLLLEIEDNGSGIPAEHLDRVFDPFFTTRGVGEGSGLGLAMVLGVASGHSGAVWASPAAQGGTVVRMLLKRVPGTQSLQVPVVQEPEFNVLLVDDEEVLLRLGKRLLTKSGIKVIATSDTVEARRILNDDAHNIDLLITDQNMPGTSGLELADLARGLNPAMRITLCTGFMPDLDRERIAELGIDAVLAKPFEINELLKLVARWRPDSNAGNDPWKFFISA
ncbi:response regulator [bacterium]|nr:response regulator [bacterium]